MSSGWKSGAVTCVAATRTLMGFLSGRCISFSNGRAGFISKVFAVFNRKVIYKLNRTLSSSENKLAICRNGGRRNVTRITATFTGRGGHEGVVTYSSSVNPNTTGVVATTTATAMGRVPLLLFPTSSFTSHRPSPILRRFRRMGSLTAAAGSTCGTIAEC